MVFFIWQLSENRYMNGDRIVNKTLLASLNKSTLGFNFGLYYNSHLHPKLIPLKKRNISKKKERDTLFSQLRCQFFNELFLFMYREKMVHF